MGGFHEVRDTLRQIGHAWPAVLFFPISFSILYMVTGLGSTLACAWLGMFFVSRYQKRHRASELLGAFLLSSLMVLLGTWAGWNIKAMLVLNLLVPFLLVLGWSTQFDPKGFFFYAMAFVFTEFMVPKDMGELIALLEGHALGFFVLVAWMMIVQRIARGRVSPEYTMKKRFSDLSELLYLMADPHTQGQARVRFREISLESTIFFQRHHGLVARDDIRKKRYDLFMILLQRFAYIMERGVLWEGWSQLHRDTLHLLGGFTVELAGIQDVEEYHAAAERARKMLEEPHLPEGRLKIFCRSYLHALVTLLETFEVRPTRREPLDVAHLLKRLKLHLSPETFEFRYGLQMAAVIFMASLVHTYIDASHTYWVGIHAFVLIQPSSEESYVRVRTRMFGTMVACIIEFLIFPYLPGFWGKMVFGILMISLLHGLRPGTWLHAMSAALYALTMAGLTIDEYSAILQRFLYLLVAVGIVLLVNHTLLPMTSAGRFRANIRALLRIHNDYWLLILAALEGRGNIAESGRILGNFHLLYKDTVAALSTQIPEEEKRREALDGLLELWHMFAEMEQIHHVATVGLLDEEDLTKAQSLVAAIRRHLYPIIEVKDMVEVPWEEVKNEDFTTLLDHYLKRAVALSAVPFVEA